MAVYSYSTQDRATTIELSFPMGYAPEKVRRKINGRMTTLYHDIAADHRDPRTRRPSSTWPMECWALGVHPNQVPGEIEKDRKLGLNVTYSKDGCPILGSPGEYRRYAESRGHFARNAGYSDPQRGGSLKYLDEAPPMENDESAYADFDE